MLCNEWAFSSIMKIQLITKSSLNGLREKFEELSCLQMSVSSFNLFEAIVNLWMYEQTRLPRRLYNNTCFLIRILRQPSIANFLWRIQTKNTKYFVVLICMVFQTIYGGETVETLYIKLLSYISLYIKMILQQFNLKLQKERIIAQWQTQGPKVLFYPLI